MNEVRQQDLGQRDIRFFRNGYPFFYVLQSPNLQPSSCQFVLKSKNNNCSVMIGASILPFHAQEDFRYAKANFAR